MRRPTEASETAVPLDSLGPMGPLGEAELETLCDRAADAGLAPYGTRSTTRDLEQLGFEAVESLSVGTAAVLR